MCRIEVSELKRSVVLGWDGVPPGLVFNDLIDRLPNLREILKSSTYGPLQSVSPPITVPAWMSMMTGCDPGQLGLYGFRHRTPGDYKEIWIPDSTHIKQPKVWDIVGEHGGKVIVIGVPPTYPPSEVDGVLISGFLAPDTERPYTYPPEISEKISEIVGDYTLDVFYRTEDKETLSAELFEMTKKRHRVAKHLLQNEEWNLFVMMEVGPDRLHHGFWRYYDVTHSRHIESEKYRSVFIRYYELLDKQLGEILELLPDDCVLILASDHGAKEREGVFCINQWLYNQGLLALKSEPSSPTSFEDLDIDWKHTKAWAWGGYYARIFINLEGYEREGCVPHDEYEQFRDTLAQMLLSIRGPNGESWENIVDKPEDIYHECNGEYPDLMLYLDDLHWRASGGLGYDSVYFYESDNGPDDAIHDWNGIYVIHFPEQQHSAKREQSILDIAPTLLQYMGLKVPSYMKGKTIRSKHK
ncbi:MAG: nucleotide pyrophosphatase [Candidatus Lokiarchaeota archaeon]|nr:nucleotide pyrophosphatase [Candidatus Lokiarchaeota archaeon]